MFEFALEHHAGDHRSPLAVAPRWLRERSIYAIAPYRVGRWADTTGLTRPPLDQMYWTAYFLVETVTGISISKLVAISLGLRVHHFGPVV